MRKGNRTVGRICFFPIYYFRLYIYFLSPTKVPGEMVAEKDGSSPPKLTGERPPQQQQPLGQLRRTKQQVTDGFTVKAMMRNTVVCLLPLKRLLICLVSCAHEACWRAGAVPARKYVGLA